MPDYHTFQVKVNLKNNASHVHTLEGLPASPLNLPPSFQTPALIYSNLGGVNAAQIADNPESEFDSWLTMGITDGALVDGVWMILDIEMLSHWSQWAVDNPISTTSGTIYRRAPGATGENIVIAQFTVPITRSYFAFTGTLVGSSIDGVVTVPPAADWTEAFSIVIPGSVDGEISQTYPCPGGDNCFANIGESCGKQNNKGNKLLTNLTSMDGNTKNLLFVLLIVSMIIYLQR